MHKFVIFYKNIRIKHELMYNCIINLVMHQPIMKPPAYYVNKKYNRLVDQTQWYLQNNGSFFNRT